MTDPAAHRQGLAAIAVGAVAMSVTGLQPLLLHGFSMLGRFTPSAAHWATLAELSCMALAVALAGTFHPPRRLRALAVVATLAYAALNLAVSTTTGDGIILLRAAAGLTAGVMVWITIGFLARRPHPEPWAAGFFLGQAVGQLVLGVALIMPHGSLGGPAFCALATLLALPAAVMTAPSYAPLGEGPLPSRRGLLGLAALLLYVAAGSGVWFHMRDFAAALDLRGAATSFAVVSTLGGQIAGAAVAVALAGRLPFAPVFAGVCGLTLAAWAALTQHPPMPVFLAVFAVSGFAGMVLGTWIFSFLIEVEPSRRAAAVSASAQLIGAALGPALGAPLGVSAALVVASLGLVLWLARSRRPALSASN